MKSVQQIRTLTYTAIAVILLLQGIWVTNAYKLIEKQVQAQANETLITCVNKELMLRKNSVIDSTTNEIVGVVNDDFEKGIFSGPELIYQEFLIQKNKRIGIDTIDSIFHSETVQQNFKGKFVINRLNPKTGEVLETTDPKGEGRLQGALESEIIPIRMDGSEGIQVLLISPYRTVFRQMLLVLFLSLLLILFVGYALFYLLRSFRNERKLRQLQNDFSHALTHNMASPLQTIYQVNSLMKNESVLADNEKRNKYIDLAQQQIVNLQALTDRILTIARAEQSPLVPNIQPTDVTGIISQLVEKFSVQAKKEVHFSTHFEPDNVLFNIDETMLNNAVSNLIDNAIKYSGETVEIELNCRLKENGLHIAVKDNGYGISTADQHIIFNKFERGTAVKRKEATGFGLGLSYVKSVAEAHLGTVNLFSKVGEGTLFELFFPYQTGKQSITNDIES
jgi:two-component system phosphate regulon sensor histidine kinase PhoR